MARGAPSRAPHASSGRAPLAVLLLALAHLPAGAEPGTLAAGVVVESVGPGLAAASAGLRPGDVILAWTAGPRPPGGAEPARGELASPFDVTQARALQADHAAEDAAARWREAAARTGEQDGCAAAWLLGAAGDVLAGAGRPAPAAAVYRGALAAVAGSGRRRGVARSVLLQSWCRARSAVRDARECFAEAAREAEAVAPDGLLAAHAAQALGLFTEAAGDLAAAEAHYRHALSLRERLAPGSAALAASVNGLGNVAFNRGDLDAAERGYERALALAEKLQPATPGLAGLLRGRRVAASVQAPLPPASWAAFQMFGDWR